MNRSAVSIVIPAYNEENTIGQVIDETAQVMDRLNLPYEIIVVDDGSIDNTRRIASMRKATVLFDERNRGKGYAMRKAFEYAQGDIIVTIDADGAHHPKEIPDMIEPLFNGADIVAGSRFLGTGSNSTTRLNRLGNLFFNAAITTLTNRRVTDSQTGFRAFKRIFLRQVDLESHGYEIETEITVKGLKNGFTFIERPITCEPRTYNKSHLRLLRDGVRIFKAMLKANFVPQICHDERTMS